MKDRLRVALLAGTAFAWLGPAVTAWTEPTAVTATATALQPYTARYQVSYRGLNGGEVESTFKRGSTDNLWLYETRAFPSLLGRMAVSTAARERSTLQLTSTGVRPLAFEFNDGKSGSSKDVSLRYDWAAGKLTGQAEGKPVAFDLTPGVQDTASVQAAMILELAAGHKPSGFRIVTGNKMRDYRYWHEGTQQVMTPYGQVQAQIWASQREGSDRVTKTWHAATLGFVPVQAIQYRKGNPEVQMRLVRWQRTPGWNPVPVTPSAK
jgi:hypothetical protein